MKNRFLKLNLLSREASVDLLTTDAMMLRLSGAELAAERLGLAAKKMGVCRPQRDKSLPKCMKIGGWAKTGRNLAFIW